jgi:hypothetical protein
MGDFNLTCCLSGISMGCEEAVFIPLIKRDKNVARGALAFDGPSTYYAPITLPIHGTLDGYGRLQDIEKTANVDCIEQAFEMPIEKFVEAITENELNLENGGVLGRSARRDNTDSFPQSVHVYGTHIHKEMYESCKDFMFFEYPSFTPDVQKFGDIRDGLESFSTWESHPYPVSVEKLGFTLKSDTGDEKIYAHENLQNVFIIFEGSYRVTIKNEESYKNIYWLKDLVTELQNTTDLKVSEEVIEEFKTTSYFATKYEDCIQEFNKYKLIYNELKGTVGDVLLIENLIDLVQHTFYPYDIYGKKLYFEIYGSKLKEVKSDWASFMICSHVMHVLGKVFQPIPLGPQYGNRFTEVAFAKKLLEVTEQRLSELLNEE